MGWTMRMEERLCREPEGRSKAWSLAVVEKRPSIAKSELGLPDKGQGVQTSAVANLDAGTL
jgi:hypothetical protein